MFRAAHMPTFMKEVSEKKKSIVHLFVHGADVTK